MSLTGTVQSVGFSPSSETPTPPEDFFAVLYIEQFLTAAQKLQALANIGALATDAINGLVSNVSFDAETSTLTVQQQNGSSVYYQLVNNQGVSNVALDGNNDLVVDFLNGNNTIVPIHNLFSGFVKKINGKEGSEITIGIADVADLTEELNNRVPVGITIKIDGIEKNLQTNPEFDTNAVKFEAQEVSLEKQQFVRNTLDVYSRYEVGQIVENITPAEQTMQDITIIEESQTVDVRLNKNIVRFNSVFAGCTISPGSKNGDTLVILNNAVSETPFNINIPVILKSSAESDVFSVAPNKNYMFWFDLAIDRWIDVSL